MVLNVRRAASNARDADISKPKSSQGIPPGSPQPKATERSVKKFPVVVFVALVCVFIFHPTDLSNNASILDNLSLPTASSALQKSREATEDPLQNFWAQQTLPGSNNIDANFPLPLPTLSKQVAPKWHFPPACMARRRQMEEEQRQVLSGDRELRGPWLAESASRLQEIRQSVEGLSSDYYWSLPVQSVSSSSYLEPVPHLAAYVPDSANLTQPEAATLQKRSEAPLLSPSNLTFICIPDGVIVDASIAGPFAAPNHSDPSPTPYHMFQNKRWIARAPAVAQFLKKDATTLIHEHGLGIQLSGWTTFTWSHFCQDTLVRLGLVYDQLMDESDPLWSTAKIVISAHPLGEPTFQKLSPLIRSIFGWLNLSDRLLGNNGWLAKSNQTYHFDMLVMPDFTEMPLCGPNRDIKDPVPIRGALGSIQRALGSLPTNTPKYIVYTPRAHPRSRSVDPSHEEVLLQAIRDLLKDVGSPLELITYNYEDYAPNHEGILDIFRYTKIMFGPHGGQLWNAVFLPPGSMLMEFNTWEDEFLVEDCRTYAYGLANAASLHFALVHADNFDYKGNAMKPRIDFILKAFRDYLMP